MKQLFLGITLAACLFLASCGTDPNSQTELREYVINGTYSVVGVGNLDADNKLHIKCWNGAVWNQQPTDKVVTGPVSLDSFKRALR